MSHLRVVFLPTEEELAVKPYPKRKAVICNGNKGIYIVDRQVICCLCEQCSAEAKARGLDELELSPTDFERHSGMSTLTSRGQCFRSKGFNSVTLAFLAIY